MRTRAGVLDKGVEDPLAGGPDVVRAIRVLAHADGGHLGLVGLHNEPQIIGGLHAKAEEEYLARLEYVGFEFDRRRVARARVPSDGDFPWLEGLRTRLGLPHQLAGEVDSAQVVVGFQRAELVDKVTDRHVVHSPDGVGHARLAHVLVREEQDEGILGFVGSRTDVQGRVGVARPRNVESRLGEARLGEAGKNDDHLRDHREEGERDSSVDSPSRRLHQFFFVVLFFF